MATRSIPRARAALLICMGGLLAACGHGDPVAHTPPASGASTLAIAANGGGSDNSSGQGGSSDQGQSSNGGDNSDNPRNDDSNSDDTEDSNADSAKPRVPNGTLTYTVVFSGHSEVDTNEKHNVFDVARKLQVTSQMRGAAIMAAVHAPTMDALNKKMEACGDDSACQQATAMSFATQQRSALEQDGHALVATLGRDRSWQSMAPCHGTASVEDRGDNHWKGWDTQLNGRVSYQGTSTFDCGPFSAKVTFNDLDLVARTDTHTYTLTLPRFQMEARYIFGDKAPTTRWVDFPSVVVKDVKFTTLDAPLHGSATLQNLDNPTEPLTEKVDWTFTPDAK